MSLSKLVLSFPMERAGFAVAEISPEVELCFPHMERMALHYVLEGEIDIEAAELARSRLRKGDFVCVPRGAEHRLKGPQATRRTQSNCLRLLELAEEPLRHRFGLEPERGAKVLSCSLNVLRSAGDYTTPTLPDVLLLRTGEDRSSAFEPPAITDRALSGVGSSAFAAGLMLALFSQAVRSVLANSIVVSAPEMQTFRFPRVAAALRMMERHYQDQWTVGRLAEAAGMAKSTFVAAFTAATGDPPSARLTAIRLKEAKRLLAGGRPIGEIASAVGYTSQAAFTRAFRRHYGHTPSDVRREMLTASPAAHATYEAAADPPVEA